MLPLIIVIIVAGIIGVFVYMQKSSGVDDDAMMEENSMKVPAPGFEGVDEMIVNDDPMMEDDVIIEGDPMEKDDAMMDGGDSMMEDGDAMMEDESPKTVTVTYTQNGFSPSPVNVRVGDTVRFVNDSGRSFWPASAFHPTHTAYPGSNITKCGTGEESRIFDACKALASGESYSFAFTEIGTWNYHDHMNASRFGSVVVK